MFYVDTHTHVISSDFERYPAAPLGGVQSAWSQEHPATVEDLLRQMDEAGVERAVMVQAATVYGVDNSYAADSLDKYRDRFTGVCTVDFLSDKVTDDLAHWISERGFKGARIRAAPGSTKIEPPARLEDERLNRVWGYLSDRGIPLVVQMLSEHTRALAEVLSRFPGMTVLLDNGGSLPVDGGPPYDAAAAQLSMLKKYDVYLKITPSVVQRAGRAPGGDPPALLRRLVAEIGHERILWGSNCPASAGSLRELLTSIEACLDWLGPAERAAVLGENARKIYNIE